MQIKSMKANYAETGFSGIIYGDGGSGKTSLLDSLPVGETAIGNIEAGLSVLEQDHKYQDFPLPSPKNPRAFLDALGRFYDMLRFEDHPFKYVALDSASELEKYIVLSQAAIGSRQIPSLKDYGDAAQLMRKRIMEFRDLKRAENNKVKRAINVFLLAGSFPLETLRTEDRVVTRRFPMLTKKFSQEICMLVDFVAHLELDGQGSRILRFHPTSEVMAKTRYKGLRNLTSTSNKSINLRKEVVEVIEAEIQSRSEGKVDPPAETEKQEFDPFKKGRS